MVNLSTDEVLKLNPNEVLFLDVRSQGEYLGGHIKGSFNIPVDEISNNLDLFKKVNSKIVFICGSGMRAQKAHKIVEDSGSKNIFILEGGMNSWISSGFEVKKLSNLWSIERQVRLITALFILTGSILTFYNSSFIYLPIFVSLGLIFASITNSCMLGYLIMKLPYNQVKSEVGIDDICEKIINNYK